MLLTLKNWASFNIVKIYSIVLLLKIIFYNHVVPFPDLTLVLLFEDLIIFYLYGVRGR